MCHRIALGLVVAASVALSGAREIKGPLDLDNDRVREKAGTAVTVR